MAAEQLAGRRLYRLRIEHVHPGADGHGASDDLNAVSKIVENGGACLERLVYNQAIALAGGIMQSMSFFGFSLRFGARRSSIVHSIRFEPAPLRMRSQHRHPRWRTGGTYCTLQPRSLNY